MTALNALKNMILETMTLGRGVPRTIDGQTFRISPQIRWFMTEAKEPQLRAFLRERVRPTDLLVDVGAHAGFYVLLFSRWAPQGKIVAFEPNTDTRDLLKRHIRLNNLTDRVTVEPFAVSDHESEMTFYSRAGVGRSRLGEAYHADLQQKTQVQTITLDHYVTSHSLEPNWLLVDVEGFEIRALRGARQVIQSRRNELTIMVEMHPNIWDQSATTRQQAEELLQELRLEPVPITGQFDPLEEYGIVHLKYLD